jgi:hypothetical protein
VYKLQVLLVDAPAQRVYVCYAYTASMARSCVLSSYHTAFYGVLAARACCTSVFRHALDWQVYERLRLASMTRTQDTNVSTDSSRFISTLCTLFGIWQVEDRLDTTAAQLLYKEERIKALEVLYASNYCDSTHYTIWLDMSEHACCAPVTQ